MKLNSVHAGKDIGGSIYRLPKVHNRINDQPSPKQGDKDKEGFPPDCLFDDLKDASATRSCLKEILFAGEEKEKARARERDEAQANQRV